MSKAVNVIDADLKSIKYELDNAKLLADALAKLIAQNPGAAAGSAGYLSVSKAAGDLDTMLTRLVAALDALANATAARNLPTAGRRIYTGC